MSKTKKANRLTLFLASKRGRQFFHVTYSVGAAIVILGALAKITHLPFGNILLSIGMVTEAFVFLISSFDVDQVDYVEQGASVGGGIAVVGGGGVIGGGATTGVAAQGGATTSGSGAGGIVIAGGGGVIGGGYAAASGGQVGGAYTGGVPAMGVAASAIPGTVGTYDTSKLSPEYIEQMDGAAKGMAEFGGVMSSLNEMSQTLLNSCKQISDSTDDVSGFSANMKTLNENIVNINAIYEAQFQSISDQISTIQYINDSLNRIKSLYDNTVMDSNAFKMENERMTRQIQELNKVYARLLQAMNVGGGGYNQGGGYPGGYNQGGGYNPNLDGGGYNPSL